MALDESIGVFPEGTSHTEPHMIAVKDGMSWAALEYVRYLQGTEENAGRKKGKKAVVVPVGIAYVDKAKYRSRVVVQ
jgi:glycerol-3-phosphate O-acyltransferase/dihydroxyacetone phosphate acyltransferase